MALLNGVGGLTSQLGSISSLLSPPKLTVTGGGPITDPAIMGQQAPVDPMTAFTPQKQITFGDIPNTDLAQGPSKLGPGDLFAQFQPPSIQSVAQQQNGQMGSLGGDASVLDQYDSAFQQEASKWGLDPLWLKSIAATERGWTGTSPSGAIGIMQIMPGGYPSLEAMYPNWQTDPIQNIGLGAAILNAKIMENGGDRDRGTMGYLGFGTDYYGTTPDSYLGSVKGYYDQLSQGGGSFGGGANATITTMFGQGAAVEDWGEFGVASDNGLYGYGTQYGLNGTQHTGVDVPMAVGSAYRAPLSGVVTCAGTNNGPGADGGGCAAFSDQFGNGAGRVEVQLDNGVVLIFGHSSTAALQPGQRFNAGDILGTSGGMVSPHIHLEARVRDSSTPSGWRIVDPRTVLGGMGGGSTSPTPNLPTGSIAQQIRQFLLGRQNG